MRWVALKRVDPPSNPCPCPCHCLCSCNGRTKAKRDNITERTRLPCVILRQVYENTSLFGQLSQKKTPDSHYYYLMCSAISTVNILLYSIHVSITLLAKLSKDKRTRSSRTHPLSIMDTFDVFRFCGVLIHNDEKAVKSLVAPSISPSIRGKMADHPRYVLPNLPVPVPSQPDLWHTAPMLEHRHVPHAKYSCTP